MSASSEIVIEIPQGKLRGKKEKSPFGEEFFSFCRIPYAEPPLGELRFRAPRPAGGWTGIRDATEEGKICPSTDFAKGTYLDNADEDSLFINVYCKESPKNTGGKKFPVMVSIHGGGFEFGSGNKDMYGPDFFMYHDIIMVTFNYRIGALGFLSLGTVECPGNFGLKDQQLALRWVKDNIVHFGGDPDNITIFGESAGGASVHYQILAMSNKGLFKRAIMQSGSALNGWALSDNPREYAFILAKRLGCDSKDDKVVLDFLRKASAKDITLKSQGIILEVKGSYPGDRLLKFTFVPSIEPEHEGAMLTKHPWTLLAEGKHLDVPLIAGMCEKEMLLSVRGPEDYPRYTKEEEFQDLIPKDIPFKKNSDRSLKLAKRLREFYFKDGINLENYLAVLSDTGFNYGVYKAVQSRTTNPSFKHPTYLYLFSYQGKQELMKTLLGMADFKGVTHGDDLPYFFKCVAMNMEAMQPGQKDYAMMRNLTQLWVKFATTGIPELGNTGVTWRETSAKDLEFLDLGDSLVMKKGLFQDRMALWDDIYRNYFNS